jgi:hypothetical protein
LQRSGPSIEVKIVILVAAIVVVQDLVLLAMYVGGATPPAMQATLGGLLVLAVIVSAVWGNAVARSLRRLTRACLVARKGDVRVLSEPDRTDEIGELNDEINRLVVALRSLALVESELSVASNVTDAAVDVAPGALHSAHDVLVSAKELREGASAEVAILRRVAGALADARTLLEQVSGRSEGAFAADDITTRLAALRSGARELEIHSDSVIDEVARVQMDEAALARAVNALRSTARAMSGVAADASDLLGQRAADARAASAALDRMGEAESARADATRVAELMDRSASQGLREAGGLAANLRRLGVVLEAYEQRRRLAEEEKRRWQRPVALTRHEP